MTQPTPPTPGQPLSDAAFDRLSLCYCMGDISPAEFDALCAALDRDPSRREAFVGLALQMETLRQAFDAQREETASLEDETAESADILNEIIQNAVLARQRQEIEHQAELALSRDAALRRSQMQATHRDDQARTGPRVLVIPKPAVWGAIAAMMLLAAFLAVQFTGPTDQPGPTDRTTVSPPPQDAQAGPVRVGQLTDAIDAVWGRAGREPGAEGALVAGRYTLVSGAVELTLGRGAEVIVQSPCTFELVDDNLARVEAGRWVASVPPSATGFTIESGQIRVVDLGTEFGVEVNAAGVVTTSVFQGEVVVGSRLDSVPSVSIKAGQAAVADVTGQVGPAQPMLSLLNPIEFARTLEDAARSPDQRYADSVLADGPLLYWRFEELAQGRVVNRDGTGRPDGVVKGSVATDRGVFGRGARFNGPESGVARIESRGGLLGADETEYTIEMWVKADRVHFGRLAGLMAETDTGEVGTAHLSLLEIMGDRDWLAGWNAKTPATTDSSFRYYHRSPMTASLESGQNLWPGRRYQAGQWMLVTAVKSKQQLALYVDGELAARAPDTQGVAGPVLLMLGSHLVGIGQEEVGSRTFAGVIDEVAVYGHALDAERIAMRYRLGLESLQSQP